MKKNKMGVVRFNGSSDYKSAIDLMKDKGVAYIKVDEKEVNNISIPCIDESNKDVSFALIDIDDLNSKISKEEQDKLGIYVYDSVMEFCYMYFYDRLN